MTFQVGQGHWQSHTIYCWDILVCLFWKGQLDWLTILSLEIDIMATSGLLIKSKSLINNAIQDFVEMH